MSRLFRSKRPSALTVLVMAVVVTVPLVVSTIRPHIVHAAVHAFPPKGSLDCNGYSKIQQPLNPYLVCAEFGDPDGGRGYDNGHYIGHDEPSMMFISNSPGSGNNVQWRISLPKEHALPATQTFENQLTFWFSMVVCDPHSYPQTPCTPDFPTNPFCAWQWHGSCQCA